MILHIVQNNPLIVKHYIVATENDLNNLIRLLTYSDGVEIMTDDIDCGCCGDVKMARVDKIFVNKNNELYNFKYSFPDAIKVWDDHKISYKNNM